MNEEKGTRIDLAKEEISISKIFKWFGEDFVEQFGGTQLFADRSEKDRSVLNLIRTYLEDKRNREFLEKNQFKMKYLKYDWSLNDLRT